LSLAARIAAIMTCGLLAAWLGAAILFYRASDQAGAEARPSPEQVGGIVDLLERTPASERGSVLRAVSSDTLRARLASPDEAFVPSDRDRSWLEPYRNALGGRAVAASVSPEPPGERLFPRLLAYAVRVIDLRIALRDGATLVLKARGPAVSRLGLPVGLGAGLIGTLIALIALIIMQRETRPLARLAAAVDRMDAFESHTPIPPSRGSAREIQALIAAFNRLGERLSTLLRTRMALLGGISHDVRTFATRLRLRIEQIPDASERARAELDIADMIRLLDDALLASRAGAGEVPQELVEFDEIVRREVEDRRSSGAPVFLTSDGRSALVLGDRVALRRIASNLIDNAIAYGRVAHVGLVVGDESVTLTVEDEGAGIPLDKRADLLEPFVRLETSRNRRTGGSGLGLAIVRGLIEAHGASLAIGDATTGGARFSVAIPLFGLGAAEARPTGL
jgi:signal transduction histidine kinase